MQPNAPFTGDPIIRNVPALRDRSMRRPKHSFAVSFLPYRLCPVALVPVMAGDTLKTASYQARALTSPLVSPLKGWHLEWWWFFCRIMDMRDGEAIMEDLIDENQSAMASETADAELYHSYGINWMQRCIELIMPHYFRDYGEDYNEVMDGSFPVLQCRDHSWIENYLATSSLPADDADAEDYENLWSKWQTLSRNRFTTQTYEEFLRSQGIVPPPNLREPDADLKIPELIRHYRDWQFPVSTINPSTGVASNAVSWAVADKMQRARRFTEPGFIAGFVTARPKEYLPRNSASGDTSVWQAGSASGALNIAKAWIPPVYVNEPGESLRAFTAGSGPVGQKAATFNYTIDHRDVFLHGDQFIVAQGTLGAQPVAVNRRDFPLWKYPTDTSILGHHSTATEDGSLVLVEGMAGFSIAGRVRDTTR